MDNAIIGSDAGLGPAFIDTWEAVQKRAEIVAASERLLAPLMDADVLGHASIGDALAARLSRKLADAVLSEAALRALFREAMSGCPDIASAAEADLASAGSRDPAVSDLLTPFLYYKGFHALQAQRVAHVLWNQGRPDLARFLQSRVSEVFAVDIHPAVPVGRRVFVDHATGLVIGETAVIGNDVSILQGVTLGGTGKETGDRHPKVRDGVLLAAGAKVLGNIEIGRGAVPEASCSRAAALRDRCRRARPRRRLVQGRHPGARYGPEPVRQELAARRSGPGAGLLASSGKSRLCRTNLS